ncbi:Panacea domain-containing protein [Roseburia faecis]|uniref:Panacea domain-containing protein n=1 Tax=Roseburia faecis TaxID=301302 RepID=UPI003F981689
MENIYEVADFFLSKESMSHKKLQKLCYYAQAWYLANYGKQLFPNRFEAWVHGPVSPDLYSRYRGWGWENIPRCTHDIKFNNEGIRVFLNQVYSTYGDYDADTLERMTHSEMPWQSARVGCDSSTYSRNPISLKNMRDYYGERIDKNWQ